MCDFVSYVISIAIACALIYYVPLLNAEAKLELEERERREDE